MLKSGIAYHVRRMPMHMSLVRAALVRSVVTTDRIATLHLDGGASVVMESEEFFAHHIQPGETYYYQLPHGLQGFASRGKFEAYYDRMS